MMGTLASGLARKGIPTPPNRYRADVEGDIEDVEGVLRITEVRVRYTLKVPAGKVDEARALFPDYIRGCPAAMSVIPCIRIQHELNVEEM